MFNKNKKTVISEEEQLKIDRKKTSQDWIPLADIKNRIIYKKDGSIFGALRIMPTNLDLLSEKEKIRKIDVLGVALNQINSPFQVMSIGRPIDIGTYLTWLQLKYKGETNYVRKMLLKNYLKQADTMAKSGDVVERRFYIFISKKEGEEIELQNALSDLKSALQRAELEVLNCEQNDYTDLFVLFSNPTEASYGESYLDLSATSVFPPMFDRLEE